MPTSPSALVPSFRTVLQCVCAVALACAALAIAAPPGGAIQAHVPNGSFDGSATPAGSFAGPNGVAIDHGSANVYVADVGHAVVDKFDASGTYLSQITGSGTLAGFFGFANPSAVAVDNSGTSTAGHVYVVDAGNDVVDEFDSSGAYLGQLTGTPPSGPFGGLLGMDVDGSGNVWVYEGDANVDEFDSSGSFITQFNTGFGTSAGFAVDSGDRTYAVRGCGCTERFDSPTASTPFADLGQLDAGFANSLAVDRSNDHVYVDDGSQVNVYDSAMSPAGSFGSGQLTDAQQGGVAVNASGDAYVANPTDNKVYIFDAQTVSDPTVTIDPSSNVTSTHATFSGTVNPQGTDSLNDTSWHFEYSTDSGTSWTNAGGADIGTGTSDVAVSTDVNTFLPNQDVQVRLVATNAAGSNVVSTVESFTTMAILPTASTGLAQDVRTDRAALTGSINPHNASTSYYFEYGPTTAYGTSVPAAQNADAGSGPDNVAAVQPIQGLRPGTLYHFRLVARNLMGTVTGADQTFTTTTTPATGPCGNAPFRVGASAGLPDCRAYELVSPPGKNGGDVMTDAQRARASADGNAVNFASLSAFADPLGSGVASDYVAERSSVSNPGTNGWATHAIIPDQRAQPYFLLANGVDPLYVGEFSSDLSKGVFLASKSLTNSPSVAKVMNLYLRSDLLSTGFGTYSLLTSCPLCDATSTPLPALSAPTTEQPYLAGASDDFRHVVFESSEPLTAGATAGQPNVYETVDGVVRLAGILPDGTPAPSSIVGQGAGAGGNPSFLTPHTVSSDGSRVFFMVPEGQCKGWTCGEVYVRLNGTSTAQLNTSERTDCADHNPCSGSPEPDPGGHLPATYWDASTDGHRVFFTSSESLTDDAPGNGAQELYMYDSTKPDSDPHNLTLLSVDREPADAPNDVDGVIGASADGHYVYFIAAGRLVPGQAALNTNAIYVWHDGVVRLVAPVNPTNRSVNLNGNWVFGMKQARVTPDGRHLLFVDNSAVGPLGYAGNTNSELYVYSAATGRLQCASCHPDGTPATSDAIDGLILNQGGAATTDHLGRPLSDDGRYVFFSTRDALLPQDTNGKSDVYEFDVNTGTLHLITTGHDPGDSYFLDASANGSDVFFATREQLLGWDGDGNYDLYDARVNGGFSGPSPPPQECSGEGCQGQPALAPGASSVGSALFSGPGNVKASPKKRRPRPLRCRHGYVKKRVHGKVRCVRRLAHKHARKTASTAKRHRASGRGR